MSVCARCHQRTLWNGEAMLLPAVSVAPPPAEDMPDEVVPDYEEARDVLARSPRSSAALLRLALQKLMKHLGQTGKDLDKDIGRLVAKGLSTEVQQALDVVRVVGNNAVHPGELDLRDDRETALMLFDLLNLIVEDQITRPKRVQEVYAKLPVGAREHIEDRDGGKP